ncbi:DUF3168 domain-containing protein [Falsigemmobacter faecalis]|uniref:DUF3168 domain-containing protein n=1 Tax=Falsigemmobacter faecalis TaxID=2488730 RepID=A0A3P3DX49_9RHOB|nr:DUF3168 domain-containing protein [Falsigemmobacter faecalis]RRH77318.1 DUF3168 domain-containing protein [Falsigemmobacter faecalis]
MSYQGGAALQAGLYLCLSTWPGLEDVLIADAVPGGTAPETWVLIGAEEVRDASDVSSSGAEHRLELSVLSRAAGFQQAKAVAAEISQALGAGGLSVAGSRVSGLWFHRARAHRLQGGALRRIDLTFRVRLDPVTA